MSAPCLPIDRAALDRLVQKCDRGRYLEVLGEFTALLDGQCPGRHPETAELAWRLGGHLELPILGRRALRTLAATVPDDPRTRYLIASDQLRRGHVFPVLDYVMQTAPPAPEHGPEVIGKHFGLIAELYTGFRDLRRAQEALDAGMEAWPDSAWLAVDLAQLRFREDRTGDALAVCAAALAKNPDYAPLQMMAAWIKHQGNAPDSVTELRNCHERFESIRASSDYATALMAGNAPAEARTVLQGILDRFRMSTGRQRSYYRSLAFVCREIGDDEAARDYAARSGEPGRELRAGFAAAEAAGIADRPRVQLKVPFVRQDHLTCVPATMASLLSFYGIDCDQREIADEITYAGTPDYEQMRWMQGRGIDVRFFEFDPDVGRALLDRGIPFTISTRYASSAHIQGVIGYDPVLRTFLLREPGHNAPYEVMEKDLIEQQRARGGGCSVPVPATIQAEFPFDQLPLEEAHMASVLFHQELSHHRLDRARVHLAVLQALPPCPLRWDAERSLAWEYNEYRQAARLSLAQAEAFPEDQIVQVRAAWALADAGMWGEQRQFLERGSRRPKASPALRLAYADFLMQQSSTLSHARSLATSAHRHSYGDDYALAILAAIEWTAPERRDRAVELYRFASCVAPHSEQRARGYFQAAHKLNQAETALAYLRERTEELGAKDAASFGTLAGALADLYREDESIEVLRNCLSHHESREAQSQLFQRLLRVRDIEAAAATLEAARPKLVAQHYYRDLHDLELARGNREAALTAISTAAEESPEQARLQERRLDLIFELSGPEATRDAALALAAAHPDHAPMQNVVYNELWRIGAHEEAEQVLHEMIDRNPGELWMRGKLCRHLIGTERAEEARSLVLSLIEQDDSTPAMWNDLGRAQALLGESEASRSAFRRSLELAANQGDILYSMLQQARNPTEAEEDLRFMSDLFRRGDPDTQTLSHFLELSDDILPKDELQELLDDLERDFPGNPDLRDARIEFLLDQGENEAALEAAERLAADFAWQAPALEIYARCLFRCDRDDEAVTVLQELIEKRPDYARAVTMLGHHFERQRDIKAAAEVYARGIERCGDAAIYAYSADLSWRTGEIEQALAHIRTASEMSPTYSWAHHTHIQWLFALDRDAEAEAVARRRVERTPTWADAHSILASVLEHRGSYEESVQEMYEALRLDPRMGDTRPTLIYTLTRLGRFDEADAVAAEGFERLGEDPELRLAAIHTHRRRGDHMGSNATLRAYLDEHPDFERGWVELLSWYEEDNDEARILELGRDAPDALTENSTFYGYLGDAQLHDGKRRPARRSFERALELSPGYDYARAALGRLVREDDSPQAEQKVYAEIDSPHAVNPRLAAQIATNAALCGESGRGIEFFIASLQSSVVDHDELAQALTHLRKAPPEARDELANQIQEAKDDDPYGFVTINLGRIHGSLGERKTYWSLIDRTWEAGTPEAARRVAEIFNAFQPQMRAEIGAWMRKNLSPDVENDDLWGLFGWANDDDETIIRFLGPSYRRPGAKSWMLANLADRYMRQGQMEQCVEVSRYALSLPEDSARWAHRIHLGYDAYLRGDDEEAATWATMPTADPPRIKIGSEALLLLIEMRKLEGFWRRRALLSRAMPRLLHLCRRIEDHGGTVRAWYYFGPELRRLCSCDWTWVLRFRRLRRLIHPLQKGDSGWV